MLDIQHSEIQDQRRPTDNLRRLTTTRRVPYRQRYKNVTQTYDLRGVLVLQLRYRRRNTVPVSAGYQDEPTGGVQRRASTGKTGSVAQLEMWTRNHLRKWRLPHCSRTDTGNPGHADHKLGMEVPRCR